MNRYIVSFGDRLTIIYATNLADAKAKGAAYFRVGEHKADQVKVRLESRY